MLAYLFSRFPVVSQTFCDTEMLALEAAGHELVIGSLNAPPNSFRHERLAKLRAEIIYPPPGTVLDLPLTNPPEDPVWRAMAALADEHEAKYGKSCKAHVRARNAWHFAREFKKRGVTHLHIHFANRSTHTALFLKKAGFTYSFTAHAQDFMVDLANDDLLREMIREATFTAAVSDYSRQLLINICPDAADRIHRVYNGIDPNQFPKAKPDAAATPDPADPAGKAAPGAPLRIISIGRLIDFKGFAVLIDAIATLRDNNIPATLQIIGEGPQRPALENQIQHLQLQNHVHLRGVLSQEEIKKELAQAHVFALACLTDSKGATDILPTVILEAMACALPVASTTLAGVPEMVLHGKTGLLAPPADAPALAAHLTTLAQDPALRARLGAAGLQHVQETFSLQKTAGHLATLFPETIKKPAAPQNQPATTGNTPSRSASPDVLVLLDSPSAPSPSLAQELDFLSSQPRVTLLATRQTPPPVLPTLPAATPTQPSQISNSKSQIPHAPEYLPDATVLEAAWRARPDLASKAESLRAEAGPVDGEFYFLTARRAVHLATQAPLRGWKKIHSLRANTTLLAWLLHRLTGLPAGATIEATHAESRAVLTKLLPAFTHGSNSDPKLKSPLPDLLKLQAPTPPKRLLGIKLPAPPAPVIDFGPVWTDWLKATT